MTTAFALLLLVNQPSLAALCGTASERLRLSPRGRAVVLNERWNGFEYLNSRKDSMPYGALRCLTVPYGALRCLAVRSLSRGGFEPPTQGVEGWFTTLHRKAEKFSLY